MWHDVKYILQSYDVITRLDLVDIIYIILCTSCEDKQLLVYFLHFTGKLLILHNFFITFNKNKHRDFSVNLSQFLIYISSCSPGFRFFFLSGSQLCLFHYIILYRKKQKGLHLLFTRKNMRKSQSVSLGLSNVFCSLSVASVQGSIFV